MIAQSEEYAMEFTLLGEAGNPRMVPFRERLQKREVESHSSKPHLPFSS
jgi:hypothetical protein